jgi:chorismate dehydratase
MKRLGISSYLNTQPLAYAFQENRIEHAFEIIYAKPNDCAEMLRNKELDAALIPSIEYARANDDYLILDTFCIGASRYVKSVELFLKNDLTSVKTVAIDSSSRTSVVLTKILLEEKFELEPEYIEMNADLDTMLAACDAALIIGDKALEQHDKHSKRLDLAEEWFDHTGLPFVFAFIAGYEDAISEPDRMTLEAAFHYGINHLHEICVAWEKKNPALSANYYEAYLKNNIQFTFGDEEKKALNVFYDYAFLRNEIDYFPEFKYYHKTTSEPDEPK